MSRTSVSLQEQIAPVERRVQLERLQLKIGAHDLRSSAMTVVSGPIGLIALFVAAGVARSVEGRKLARR